MHQRPKEGTISSTSEVELEVIGVLCKDYYVPLKIYVECAISSGSECDHDWSLSIEVLEGQNGVIRVGPNLT